MHDWRADVRSRLAALGLRPQDEAEIVEEVAQHLEAQFAELVPVIGAAAARAQLIAQLRDHGFDGAAARRRHLPSSRTPLWGASSTLRDVGYGLRSLRRAPGMMAAGIAALALGIGLTTVMYSVIYGLLIKGLPFRDPARIAYIYHADPERRADEFRVTDFLRLQSEQRSFEAFGGWYEDIASVSGGDRPEHVQLARMTAGAFDVTGVHPMLGRTFTAADNAPGASPTAVLGYAMWRDRFAGDSNAVGKSVHVNGQTYTIVGVMPDGYEFPQVETKLWLPAQLDTAAARASAQPALIVIGRLRPGVGYDDANAELAGLSQRLARERTDSTAERRAVAEPFIRAWVPSRVYALLYAMLGAVFLVLLVACANVTNLLLDRAANRTREVGIRLALGASRMAVVRQALVESTILAILAAVVGTGLAQGGIVAFNRAMAANERPYFWTDIRLDAPMLLFVLAIAIVASIASGLLPAIQSARLDVNTILKDESHAASSLRVGKLSRAIVTAEIALSSAMLLAAGFMTESIVRLRAVEPHFASADVFTALVSLPPGDTLAQRRFFETLERNLAAVPGLGGVYVGNGLPGAGWAGARLAIEGRSYARAQDRPLTNWLAVNPGFFRAFGVGVLRGRPLLASDRAGAPSVAVVSEAFARRYFPKIEPIGRRIRLGRGPGSDSVWTTIIGVIPTLYATSIQDPFPPEVLTAFWQERRFSSASIALRGPASVAGAAALRSVVATLNAEVPVYATATMSDVLARPMWPVRVFGTMFVIFGVASLLLAAIGLYAVVAFSVSRRVREMGIRMALGATSGNVIRMICWQGAKQIVLGMFLGLAVGAAAVKLLHALLFEVHPNDPVVYALVVGVLGVTAFVACIIPAIGATRADPVIALRVE
jgi:predicted permease